MKYLFVFLLVGLMASCGEDASGDAAKTKETKTDKYSTVKIGNLEIMTEDLGEEMAWMEAKKACADLGDGWRLPTKVELNILYENKDEIGGFAIYGYWSSTETSYGNAWEQRFGYGSQSSNSKDGYHYVRAVRAF
ncbi:DUF1566 domain-containing protein [Crocinitomicaceae bacterium]|nr:DUF1566 domain-containing protein [Crocinitomicaceae bacterium]